MGFFVFLQMSKGFFGRWRGFVGLCLHVVGVEVKGISCSVQMDRIMTFFIDGSSWFCRIVDTIDEGRKMALWCVVVLVYKGVWAVIHSC